MENAISSVRSQWRRDRADAFHSCKQSTDHESADSGRISKFIDAFSKAKYFITFCALLARCSGASRLASHDVVRGAVRDTIRLDHHALYVPATSKCARILSCFCALHVVVAQYCLHSLLLCVYAAALSYVGQGMIMGPRTCWSMLLGATIGWGILGPIAHSVDWAPGSIGSYTDGAKGYVAATRPQYAPRDDTESVAFPPQHALTRSP